MAKGFGLDIPEKFLRKIDEADQKIKDLAKTSEATKNAINRAFNDMANGGVQAFINKLNEAQAKLSSLSASPIKIDFSKIDLTPLTQMLQQLSSGSKSTTVKIQGIDVVGQQANSAVDAVNRLMMAINQLAQVGGGEFTSRMTSLGKNTFKDFNKEANRMVKTISKLDTAIWAYSITSEKLAEKIKQARAEQEKFNQKAKELAKNDVSTLSQQRGTHTTLNELKAYASELKKTMANLDPKSQEWLRLNSIFKDTTRQINQINQSMKDYQQQHRNIMDISGQLQRRLSLLFSVSQITGYVGKMIAVRKEFEIQQKSLQVLLKSKEDADKLWKQTIDLAVKSPFTVKELVTYTRQLAAYRIETDQLHDTTKRLADVSAGLGVDMNRLILAFGQVKAANFLRGTELRQFTEAGIPMLDELAKHFTEMEGRAISAGQVFEMISKRMVSFKDVEQVFKNMTDEGGTFYKMQEEQSKTLKGMISNLYDSIDLMLNEIGKSQEGFMKGVVKTLKTIVESHEEITRYAVPLLVVLTARWALLKGEMMLTSGVLKSIGASMWVSLKAVWVQLQGLTIGFKQSTAAAKQLAAATKGASLFGGWVTVLSAIALVGWEVYNMITSVDKAQESLNKNIGESKAELDKQVKGYENLVGRLSRVNKGSDEHKEIIAKLNSQYGQYIGFIVDENTQYEKLYGTITKVTNALTQKAKMSAFEKTYSDAMSEQISIISESEKKLKDILRSGIALPYEKQSSKYKWIIPTEAEINDIIALIAKKAKETNAELTVSGDLAKVIADYYQVEEAASKFNLQLKAEQESLENFSSAHIKLAKTELELEEKINDAFNSRTVSTLEARKEFEKLEKEREQALEKAKNAPAWEIEDIERNFALRKIKLEVDYEGLGKDVAKDREEALKLDKTIDSINQKIKGASDKLGEKYASRVYITKDEGIDVTQIAEQTAQAYRTQQGIIKAQNALKNKGNAYDKEALESATKLSAAYLFKLQQLGREDLLQKDINKEESKELTLLNKQLSALKEARNAYKENRKLFNKEEATKKTLSAYQPLFDELKIGDITQDIDFEVEGVIDVLDKLPNAAGERGEQAIQKLRSGFMSELGDFEKELENKNFIQSIENLFDNYQISLELEKLNIPKDMAKQFFGVDSIDLSKIRTEILKMVDMGSFAKQTNLQIFNSKEFQNLNKEQQNIVRKFLEQVSDMETKAQQERLKTYLQYARDAVSERAKIKLEEMRKLQEIERTFTKPEQETEKQKARDKVKQDSEQELNKLEWKEFQKSDTFVRLFKDLDNASSILINHSIDKLKEFKEQWKDMPVEDMKSIVDKINQLELKLAEIKPFGGTNYKDLMREMEKNAKFDSSDAQKFADKGKYKQAFEQEGIFQEEAIQRSAQYIADLEAVIRLKEEGNVLTQEEYNLTDQQQSLALMSLDALKDMHKLEKESKDDAQEKLNNSNNYLGLLNKQQKKLQAQANAIEAAQKMANDLYNEFSNLADALGAGDGPGRIFADMGMQMMNTVLNTLMLQVQLKAATIAAEGLGIALNSAMGIVGWIVMAVQLIVQGLTAIFKVHDNNLQEQIEKLEDDVEVLEKKFEKLEKAIDDAFSLNLLKENSDAAIDNLDEQIAKTKQMIALEEQKKDTDYEKIKEWKKEIEEMQEQQEELRQQMVSIATGGIFDSVRDAASEFTDAWLEAYKETGDGMKGLEDSFQEMLQNMLKQQATMLITGKFLDSWKKELDKYVHADDLHLTTEEAKTWVSKIKNDLPALSEALEAYFRLMEEAGVDLTGGDGELTGLQKGIQGVTEDTAQIIEGYLNSIRFFVSEKHRLLSDFINAYTNPEIENPIVSQLKIIATQTGNIYELLRDLIAPHNTQDGRGLKVIM